MDLTSDQFWHSEDTTVLYNPRMPQALRKQNDLDLLKNHLLGHVWIATSGSSGIAKWTALSKKALLASAKAVNEHLQSTVNDIWINPLPDFHVGGLGIWARAYLSGAQILDYKKIAQKWCPSSFLQFVSDNKATLTSLVPTQVYDLVQNKLKAPGSLRAVIVGGGALATPLYTKALSLGWPLLPSYGLTECCSQVATAALGSHSPLLKILSHIEIKIDADEHICIKSPSLLTLHALMERSGLKFIDPIENSWLKTEDVGSVDLCYLHVKGRIQNFIKIGGESVDLTRLSNLLDEIQHHLEIESESILFPAPDERLGHVIHLFTTGKKEQIATLLEQFHQKVCPYEHVRQIHYLEKLPRTAVGKIDTELLKKST